MHMCIFFDRNFRLQLKKELSFYDMSIKACLLFRLSVYKGKYVKYLRYCEYCKKHKGLFFLLLYFYYNIFYMRLGYKLGYEIPLGTVDWGLKIYHMGSIIVNGKIGKNVTLYPGVCVGQKGDGNKPTIGDNCFLGLGSKIIGSVILGDNVIVAPNAVVVKDVPSNCTVGGVPAKIIKQR